MPARVSRALAAPSSDVVVNRRPTSARFYGCEIGRPSALRSLAAVGSARSSRQSWQRSDPRRNSTGASAAPQARHSPTTSAGRACTLPRRRTRCRHEDRIAARSPTLNHDAGSSQRPWADRPRQKGHKRRRRGPAGAAPARTPTCRRRAATYNGSEERPNAPAALSGRFLLRPEPFPRRRGACGQAGDSLNSRLELANDEEPPGARPGRGHSSLWHRRAPGASPEQRVAAAAQDAGCNTSSVASGRARNRNGTKVVPSPAETCMSAPSRS
jgi:hypothetical protein